MSRKKGLNQKPMAIRLDNDIVEPLKRYAAFTNRSVNRAINDCVRHFTDKYLEVEKIRIPGLF